MKRFAVAFALVFSLACAKTPPNTDPTEPTPAPSEETCRAMQDPAAILRCLAEILGPFVPAPTPRPSATASPAPTETATALPTVHPTPTPTPRPTGTAGPVRIDQVKCSKLTGANGGLKLHKYVRKAILDWQQAHLGEVMGDKIIDKERFTSYYFEIAERLNAMGPLSAVVDDCIHGICGEIAVKFNGTKRGEGWHEQYSVLVSSGVLRYREDSYRSTCTPAGF